MQKKNIRLALDEQGGLKLRADKHKLNSELIAAIKQHKNALILQLQKKNKITAASHEDKNLVPITKQQYSLWLQCQAYGDNTAYHMPLALKINTLCKTQRELFLLALNSLINQQALFNYQFIEANNQVLMQRKSVTPLPIQVESQALENSADAIKNICKKWFNKPFNLHSGDLFRCSLFEIENKQQSNKNSYLLLINIHHIIWDGASNSIFLQDLMALYQQYSKHDKPLPQASNAQTDYLDYALWQQQYLADPVVQKSIQEHADDLNQYPPLNLFDPSIQHTKNANGTAHTSIILSKDTQHNLQQCSQQLQVSRFSIFLSCWQITLAKLSQQKRFSLAMPINNRAEQHWQRCTGFFVNTIAISCEITNNQSLLNLLNKNQQWLMRQLQNTELPLSAIIEKLNNNPSHDLSSLFQAAINYQNVHDLEQLHKHIDNDVTIDIVDTYPTQAKFPLCLNISDGNDLQLLLEYQQQHYSEHFINMLASAFDEVLQQVVAQKKSTIAQIELLTKKHKQAILGLNKDSAENYINPLYAKIYQDQQTQSPLSECTNLATLIHQQAQRSRNDIACSIVTEGVLTKLSYAELDHQSDLIALELKKLTANIIGILMPRSLELIVVLIAILKSGKAYCVLQADIEEFTEHGHQHKRINEIIDDAKIEQIFCQQHHLHKLITVLGGNIEFIAADDSIKNLLLQPSDDIKCEINQNCSLFNITYTSGSTGKPKGVRVLHQGIINRLQWMQKTSTLSTNDVVLQKTPISFDVSVWELFWPLLYGARLHFAGVDEHKDPISLLHTIKTQNISHLHFVPAMLNMFLQQGPANEISALTSIKAIYLSGEAADKNTIATLFNLQPKIKIFNLYGPTEASIDVSYYQCHKDSLAELESVPIGQPIDNHQLFILDQQLQVLPAGISGELYIAGIGLAEGYQDRQLDPQNFIDNPYYLDGSPWPQLYKTGDLCYYNDKAELCYFSRNDDQVKLRGVRIELNEIQQRLLQYPHISQSQIIIDKAEEKIFAFYQSDRLYEATQLREYLLSFLPIAYLPNQFIPVDTWPNTPHGKLDKKSLLALAKTQLNRQAFNSSNKTEAYLQMLWQTLLNEKPLPCNIGFFELGGHSLLASQMLQTVAKDQAIELNFRHIFDYPTIAELAQFIQQQKHYAPAVNPLIALSKQESYGLSRQQRYLYQWQEFSPENTAYNMPATLFIEGNLDNKALEYAINQLLRQQKVLSSIFKNQGDEIHQYPQQDYKFTLVVENIETEINPSQLSQWITVADTAPGSQSHKKNHQALKDALQQHSNQPFDLSLHIPLRIKVFKTATDQAFISLVVHHIAADAGSLELIVEQLQRLYLAYQAGQDCDVSPAIQYHDYSLWQAKIGFSLQSQQFWQQQLQHAPLYTQLVNDVSPADENLIFNSSSQFIRRTLSSQHSNNIKNFCQQLHTTPYILLLSFYQLLLMKLSDTEEVCIGITSNARNEQGLQQCIGYFVNSLLARSDIKENPDTRQFLHQQKQQLLKIWQYQDIDLQALWSKQQDTAIAHESIGYLCSFNYLQPMDKSIEYKKWAGLDVTVIDSLKAMSKFDLCMHVYEEADQFSLLLEFNDHKFTASKVQTYLDKFIYLLQQGMQNSEAPIPTLNLQPLSAQQNDFIAALVQKRQLNAKHINQIYAATAMQRDILSNAQMDKSNRQNYLGFVSWVKNDINTQKWQQAIDEIIKASDSLNTLMMSPEDNSHYLNVEMKAQHSGAYKNYSYIDFTDIDFDERAALNFADRFIYHPYTEANKPYWRAQLVEFSDQCFMFVLACHHALMDGVSLQLLGDQIKCRYEEKVQKLPSLQTHFEHGFVSFAKQQKMINDSYSSQQYWNKVSASLTHIPKLIRQENSDFSQHTLSWKDDTLLKLLQHCKRQHTTVANYIKSIYALALQQTMALPKAADFLIHDVVSGRNKSQFNQLGLFFDIQPNLISLKEHDNAIQFIRALAKQRKIIDKVTPLSLATQNRIFKLPQLFLFNFYVMETETQFLKNSQQIRHFIPEQKQDISLICKLSSNTFTLSICADEAFSGRQFLQLMQNLHNAIISGETSLQVLLQSQPTADIFTLIEANQDQRIEKNQEKELDVIITAENSQTTQIQNSTEAELLQLWQHLFKRQDININADFFSLGGHSLLAMQLQQQLQQRFGINLPAQQFFQNNSIRHIANYLIEHKQEASLLAADIPIQHKQQAPLSSAQMRLWFLCQDEISNAAYNIPLAIRLPENIETTSLQTAFHLLLLKHPILRSQISLIDQEPRLIEKDFAALEIDQLIQQQQLKEENLTSYLATEQKSSFNLIDQFLIRIKMIHVTKESYNTNDSFNVLSICLHHIISDAQSMFILLRDLYAIYTQLQQTQESTADIEKSLTQQIKLDLKTHIQYSDFCLWQATQHQQPEFQAAIVYWLGELEQAPLLLGLPYDKKRPDKLSFNGDHVDFTLDEKLQSQLQTLAQTQGCSLFTLLLSSYQLLLHLISGQEDICVGIPNHGRQQAGLQNICGFFVNAIVIRCQMEHNPSFSALLQQTQSKLSTALKHQHAPAERVFQQWANNANIPNQLNYMPIVQAAFNYLDAPDNNEAVELQALGFNIYPTDFQTAKFELLLNVQRNSDEQLYASVEYNSDLFERSSILHVTCLWQELLESLCTMHEDLDKSLYQYQSDHLLTYLQPKQLQDASVIMPTTSMQRDLLLASIKKPTTLENSIGYALELPVKVDIEQYKYSLSKLYENYPILSAQVFDIQKYQQNQFYFLLNKNNIAFTFIDLSQKTLSETAIKNTITDLIYKPYMIKTDALLQHYLIKVDDQRFYTVLACHHALLDGLSFTLHAYHLVSNYLAAIKNEPLTFSKNHYDSAIEASLNTIDKPETVDYWALQLQNCQPLSYNLVDGLTPAQRSDKMTTDDLTLSELQYKNIRSFCKKEKITVALYFKALYSLLIRFYCQSQNNFYISEFNNGRNRKQLTTMGCFFQRHLFIASHKHLIGSFSAFVEQIKNQQRTQASLQNLSLLKQQELMQDPGLSFSYNYIYMPKSGEADGISFDGQSFSPQYEDNIDLRVQLDKGQLSVHLSHQMSLFNNLNFLQRLLAISDQIISGQDQTLSLDYRLEHEKHDFENPINTNFHSSETVLERIEKQALDYPQALAIEDPLQKLSYQKLLDRSYKLAAFLIQQEVKPGDVVAICAVLNCDYVVMVLAILKAGACYLPIDTKLPNKRKQAYLNQSECCFAFTQQSIDSPIIQWPSTEITSLTENITETASVSWPQGRPEDHFYLIYTSGSTGAAKAVNISHANIQNLQNWYGPHFQFKRTDTHLIFTSIGFDLTQKNLFAPLLTGGRILCSGQDYDPSHIAKLITQHSVTIINAAPSAIYPILAQAKDKALPLSSLRLLLFGGEAINVSKLNFLLPSNNNIRLVNMYGPAECTDITTSCEFNLQQIATHKPLALAQSNKDLCPGVSLTVLNDLQQKQPPGFIGQLIIKGPSISADYIDADTQSYATGDRVYQLPVSGELIFHSRNDQQLNIRGHRVDSTEVTFHLRQYLQQSSIAYSQIFIDYKKDFLIAYIESTTTTIDEGAIATYLSSQLASYAIPQQYVLLQDFPINKNGKVDKSALWNHYLQQQKLQPNNTTKAIATTDTEKTLLHCWQQQFQRRANLQHNNIGIDENFFACGGDSLMAVNLVHDIEQQFSIKLPVSAFLQAQTIRLLADYIDNKSLTQQRLHLLQAQGTQSPIFAIHGFGGLVFNYYPLAQQMTEQAFYALQASGFNANETVFTKLDDLIEDYFSIIDTQMRANGENKNLRLMGFSFGGLIAHELAKKLITSGYHVEEVILLDSYYKTFKSHDFIDQASLIKIFINQNFPELKLGVLLGLKQKIKQQGLDQVIEQLVQDLDNRIDKTFILNSLALMQGFLQLSEDYPQDHSDFPIRLIRAKQALGFFAGKDNGWSQLNKQVWVLQTKMKHFDILKNPKITAELINRRKTD